MNFNFIASFVTALAIFSFLIRRSGKQNIKATQLFWEKENKANATRKKSLDNLDYITIPDEVLYLQPLFMTAEIESYLQDLRSLSQEKIVNLTGISNTDLKLAYGTANITVLSEYDFHYTTMVTTLQKLAECLVKEGEDQSAITVLEFAVSTRTDVSKSYTLLASLYQQHGDQKKIDFLIQTAQKLNSIMKDSIVRSLKASGQ